MTIYEMRQKMPVTEMLAWIQFWSESNDSEPGVDLHSASPEQLKGLFS
jgi:hypothetical protein